MAFRQAHVWTEDQDNAVLNRVANGKSQVQLSNEIGVSVWLICQRGQQLARRQPTINQKPVSDHQPDYTKMAANRWTLPPGHPITWGAITKGTLLEGSPYPVHLSSSF